MTVEFEKSKKWPIPVFRERVKENPVVVEEHCPSGVERTFKKNLRFKKLMAEELVAIGLSREAVERVLHIKISKSCKSPS